MKARIGITLAALLALSGIGCGAFKSDAPVIDVNRATGTGAILGSGACAVVHEKFPDEIVKAATAAKAAREVLTSTSPSLSAIQDAINLIGKGEGTFYITIGVNSLMGGLQIYGVSPTDLIEPGSPVSEGLKSFFNSCLISLGQVA